MSRYQPPNSIRRRGEEAPSLPQCFTPIEELLKVGFGHNKFVHLVGAVKDYRHPIPTRRADYKCSVTLFDLSTQCEGEDIELNIFRPEEEMPVMKPGDIVIVFAVKTQTFNSNKASLLTSFRSDLHVYDGKSLSECKAASAVPLALRHPSRRVNRKPGPQDNEYVLWLCQKLDKTIIPDDSTTHAGQSLNVKEKFSMLKDVKENKFADLIVEVAKQPFDLGDKITLWVSDYTEHHAFFNQSANGMSGFDHGSGRDGDPYGYTSKFKQKHSLPRHDDRDWVGPSGRMSMQITCWEPHANFVRDQVSAGDWLRLRNVQIKLGHSGSNLEGFLREDLKYSDRVYVEKLDAEADGDVMSPKLKDAIRRKRDYEREHRRNGRQGQGNKRSAPDEPEKETAKSKRKKSRTEKQKERQEKESKAEEELGLNELIICENHDKTIVPLSTILETVPYHTTVNNKAVELELPFTNANFRTQVRVVDFHPIELKDFAVSVKKNKYACLASDDEDDGNISASSEGSEIDPDQLDRPGYTWEWRFALKVTEANAATRTKKKPAATTWVFVNNQDAQLLTSIDAANLHAPANNDRLTDLREKMFTLWGNLEECKSREEAVRAARAKGGLKAPPVDSDAEDDGRKDAVTVARGDALPSSSQLSNKPFRCCLRQYGIKVEAEAAEDENAGEGYRWERILSMFGTKIRGD